MVTAAQNITPSSARGIAYYNLPLSQPNVRRIKAGILIEEFAESIARCGLIRSKHVCHHFPSFPRTNLVGTPHIRAGTESNEFPVIELVLGRYPIQRIIKRVTA